ncbi:hybrid sensor histidine kinase/response regulator [Megalodesulfovibrio paquesii]
MDEARFFQKLRAAFQAEAAERIASLEAALDVLDDALTLSDYRQHPEARPRLEAMYRELHSLKGAGRTVELPALESLCQGLESALWRIKRDEAVLEYPLLQQLREAVVLIRSIVAAAASEAAGPSVAMVKTFLGRLESPENSAVSVVGAFAVPPPASAEAPDSCSASGPELVGPPSLASPPQPLGSLDTATVRLPTAALEALLGQVEGLLTSKSAASLHTAVARSLREDLGGCLRAAEGTGHQATLEHLVRESESLTKALTVHQRTIAAVVDELLESITQTLLLPWNALLEAYPRMVREIAASQGKQVQLVVQGADASIDRRILEQLGDAFLHLLRNAVDHGIETPEARLAAGKPAQGRIDIRIEVLGGDRTRIVISDDGRGVDFEAIRRKAVQHGIFSAEEAAQLDESSLLELIWRPEFSTRDHVDSISGRGLGMDIVQSKLARVGGSAQLRSTRGRGSVVSLHLPLTLMRFEGLVIMSGGRRFVVRKSEVLRVVQAPRALGEATTETGSSTSCAACSGMLVLDGAFIHVASMARLLGLEQETAQREGRTLAEERRPVLIVGEDADARAAGSAVSHGADAMGLMVDAIIGETDVTLRGLGPQLAGLRGVRGVVLMGDGALAPVLNMIDLRRMAREGVAVGRRPARIPGRPGAMADPARPRRPRRIMVAEDSITSRMLLKNVLETAGYVVLTAVDGQEALERLHSAARRQDAAGTPEAVDALVSDVEMPRMDGFELVRQLRADAQLAALPVVLVTSLADPAHQEAGMQAGADAYIVKSRFDQSDLLQTLARLLPAG